MDELTAKEQLVLNLFYNRFYDLFDEITMVIF